MQELVCFNNQLTFKFYVRESPTKEKVSANLNGIMHGPEGANQIVHLTLLTIKGKHHF